MDEEYRELVKDDENLRKITLAIFSALPDRNVDIFFDTTTIDGTIFMGRVLELRDRFKLKRSQSAVVAAHDEDRTADRANKFAFTRPHQMKASDLSSSNKVLSGSGYLPLYTQHLPREEIEYLFIPSPDEIERARRHPIFQAPVCELRYFEPANEAGRLGTQKCLEPFFRKYNFFKAEATTLKNLGIANGAVTTGSKCDFFFVIDDIALGVAEMKGAEASLALGMRQAVGYSTHIAMRLLDLGLPYDVIYIPSISCNGTLIQFGVTLVLSPSFPSFVPISPVLDIAWQEQTVIAYMEKSCTYMRTMHERIIKEKAMPSPAKRVMLLDTEVYFLKLLSENVLDRGLGKFRAEDEEKSSFDAGLLHMFRGLERLYRSPQARNYVVFPLSVRTPNSMLCEHYVDDEPNDGGSSTIEGSGSNTSATESGRKRKREFTPEQQQLIMHTKKLSYHALVYRDITQDGFRMGVPKRFDEEEHGLFDKFILALRTAVEHIHQAGVIHGDLYPSNIFWKKEENGEISIKIIDWDICHCVDEESFHPKVQAALNKHEGHNKLAIFGPEHDLRYIAALTISPSTPTEQQWWVDIATGDRKAMNKAFRKIFKLFLHQNMEEHSHK